MINYKKLIMNTVWLLFCLVGSVTFPFLLYTYLYNLGWVETYREGIGINPLGGMYVILTVLLMLILLVVTLFHIFDPEWDFWEALARKFPATEKDSPHTSDPPPADWR